MHKQEQNDNDDDDDYNMKAGYDDDDQEKRNNYIVSGIVSTKTIKHVSFPMVASTHNIIIAHNLN